MVYAKPFCLCVHAGSLLELGAALLPGLGPEADGCQLSNSTGFCWWEAAPLPMSTRVFFWHYVHYLLRCTLYFW